MMCSGKSYKGMYLCPFSFGIAWGIVCAFSLAGMAWCAWMFGTGTAKVELMASFYYGYSATLSGVFWGFFWGFIKGFFLGAFVGLIYDFVLCCCSKCKKSDCACCKGGGCKCCGNGCKCGCNDKSIQDSGNRV